MLSASWIPLSRRCKRLSYKHGSMPRCNQWRAGSSLRFIERAKKRVENARKEVEDAKAKLVAAETTLTSEVRVLKEGEERPFWRKGCQRSHHPRCN